MQDLLQLALGQRIRELRGRRKISQEMMAELASVHRTFIGTIERGETNLSFQNMAKIAEALGITLSQLFSGLEKRAKDLEKGRLPK